MGKTLVIAEKPSVAADIARILGCTIRGEGCVSNDRYIVTWAVGHLVTLKTPDEIDERYAKWTMDDLPLLPESIPLKVIESSKKQYQIVKKLFNDSETDRIICATDAGREGELIFHYIYIQSGCRKPFDRLWISSMTDEAIREGFRSIRPGHDYDDLYQAARARSEADWLVGMNASRAYSIRYNARLTVGRVQTPTLAMLVARKDEIEHFVPQKYATLTASFGDYSGTFFSDAYDPDTHIPDLREAEAIRNAVLQQQATVLSAETVRKKEQPPQLYDLTSLQRDANRVLGFTADKTLKLAQSLYETHKALTYPRTDSRYLPPDMVPRVVETMHKLPDEYQKAVAAVIPGNRLTVTGRTIDASKVSDHHALLPTSRKPDLSAMSADERNLWELVTLRMLCAFAAPCEYDATKIITEAASRQFRTTGKVIRVPGWRSVRTLCGKAEPAEDTDEEDQAILPALSRGDRRAVQKADVREGLTKPPAYHTDASLLTAMETAGMESDDEEIVQQMKGHGIGTPATRAAIIEHIIHYEYAQRKGKSIIATDKGAELIRLMPVDITSAETTGRWEAYLDKIANHTGNADKFMDSIRKFASALVEDARTASADGVNERALASSRRKGGTIDRAVCPICGKGSVFEGVKTFKCSEYKDSHCGFTLFKDCIRRYGGPVLNQEILENLLKSGSATVRGGRVRIDDQDLLYSRKGDSEDHRISMVYTGPSGESGKASSVLKDCKCPVCGNGDVFEGPNTFLCTNRPKCRFTLFKNCLDRAQGPVLDRQTAETLLREKFCRFPGGGLLLLNTDAVRYYRSGEESDTPDAQCALVYDSNRKSSSGNSTHRGKSRSSKHTGSSSYASTPGETLGNCPLCRKGQVRENAKAFGCTRWRDGCKFTIWKNCLERAGGPEITKDMLNKLLDSGRASVPGGEVWMTDSEIRLYRSGSTDPVSRASLK